MATLFDESWDHYATTADMLPKWAAGPGGNGGLVSGVNTQFQAGQALLVSCNNAAISRGAFGSNVATVYFSIRFRRVYNGASTVYVALGFGDGATNQCCVRLNADGSLSVHSGGPGGTSLGSLAASTFTQNVWYSLQGKVVIDNTAGSVEIRVNGSGSNSLTLTGVNTRGGTTNFYTNSFIITNVSQNPFGTIFYLDDLYVATGAWLPDMHSMAQGPTTPTQTQWTQGGAASGTFGQNTNNNNRLNPTVGTAYAGSPHTVPVSGTIQGGTLLTQVGTTCNAKVGIYDCSSGYPTTLLATSASFSCPQTSTVTFNLTAPLTVAAGQVLAVALITDTALMPFYYSNIASGSLSWQMTGQSFAGGFPATYAYTTQTTSNAVDLEIYFAVTTGQASFVGETVQNGNTSYVTATTSGTEDVYTMGHVNQSFAVVGVTYFACWELASSGTGTVKLSVAAGGSAETTEISNSSLTTSYLFSHVHLLTDPASAPWTPPSVQGALLGLGVTVTASQPVRVTQVGADVWVGMNTPYAPVTFTQTFPAAMIY